MKELTPEEEFNKIIGESAASIKALENQLANLQSPNGPKPEFKPSSGPGNTVRPSVDAEKYRLQEGIFNLKADAISKTDAIISGMPKNVQPQMKQKVMDTFYQEGRLGSNKETTQEKSMNDAQENLMQDKANIGRDRQPSQPNNPGASRFTQGLNYSPTAEQPAAMEQTKKDAEKPKDQGDLGSSDQVSSMSTRFTQSLGYSSHSEFDKDESKQPPKDSPSEPDKVD